MVQLLLTIVINNKKMEYHYQIAIMNSPKYK